MTNSDSHFKQINNLQRLVSNSGVLANQFLEQFKEVICGVMKNGYAVDHAKLTTLKVNLKKVPNVLK